MTHRSKDDASALRTGLVHTGLSLLAFSAIGGAGAGALLIAGDDSDAGPRIELALFEEIAPRAELPLKSRFAVRESDVRILSVTPAPRLLPPMGEAERDTGMGVIDPSVLPDGARVVRIADARTSDASTGDVPEQGDLTPMVRINGRAVPSGMSLSSVDGREQAALQATATRTDAGLVAAPVPGLFEIRDGLRLPVIAEDGRTPAAVYARPGVAAPDQPRVALIVGGLGLNWRITQQAIDELPPEVTLSFSPHAADLQIWIDRARKAGHEVLIEVSMEPYDWGSSTPPAATLVIDADAQTNIAKLFEVLSSASGYFGVMNYQGARFATDLQAATPVLDELKSRGLVFIEDGSIGRSVFGDIAASNGLSFARAGTVIDAEQQASSIENELARLESRALEGGYALGTGFAYPVTVDTVRDWSLGLQARGIALVPASGVASVPAGATPETSPEAVEAEGVAPDDAPTPRRISVPETTPEARAEDDRRAALDASGRAG